MKPQALITLMDTTAMTGMMEVGMEDMTEAGMEEMMGAEMMGEEMMGEEETRLRLATRNYKLWTMMQAYFPSQMLAMVRMVPVTDLKLCYPDHTSVGALGSQDTAGPRW
mmetsp:Transcript_19409/g.30382  ORF Transcript_19409/g.30382 Transcript_19409/m.30382 type:complete len:109 (+) Transcript_19409:1340-1666(+)